MENLSPHVIKQVTKELNKLVTEPLEGIKVLINDEDVTNIEAVIEGPGKQYIVLLIITNLGLSRN